jgi:hypothetical protein
MKTIIPKTTSVKTATIDLIKSLVGQANVLSIPVEFIHYTGSVDCALFLSQLLYWSDRGIRRDGYIWKTYGDWEKEVCLSEYKVRNAANRLKSMGILETMIKKANGSPTVHYRLDLDKFSDSFVKFLQERKASNFRIQGEESSESLTETTTENTSNILSLSESYRRNNFGSSPLKQSVSGQEGQSLEDLRIDDEIKFLYGDDDYDLELELARFKDYCRANGKTYESYRHGFYCWLDKKIEHGW